MFKPFIASAAILTGVFAAQNACAWSQPTHKEIVKDAIRYMGSQYATPEQRRAFDFYVHVAGSADNAGEVLGQGSYDVDDFKDTHLGEWWRPYEYAPLGGLAASIVKYTSYWHFQNHTRGTDAHGNHLGGYDFRYHTVNGSHGGGEFIDIDWWAMVYLYNLQLKPSDFDTTEAHYRQGSYSNIDEHYEDFQAIAWQPVDNLGKYWFDQFKAAPSLQTIGYSLHAIGDVGQPHHVYITSANNHAGWESWVKDYYAKENMGDLAAVALVADHYNNKNEFRDIATQLGNIAYAHPEPLYDTTYETRARVAKELIPNVIAATVAVLTKGVNYVYGEGGK